MITSGGPSGIRTQDRRIKSQWLKLQNSTKTHETAGKRTKAHEKTQISGRQPGHFRYEMVTHGDT